MAGGLWGLRNGTLLLTPKGCRYFTNEKDGWSVIVYCGLVIDTMSVDSYTCYSSFRIVFPHLSNYFQVVVKKQLHYLCVIFFPYYYETTHLYESPAVFYQSTMTVSGMQWNLLVTITSMRCCLLICSVINQSSLLLIARPLRGEGV